VGGSSKSLVSAIETDNWLPCSWVGIAKYLEFIPTENNRM